MQEYLDNTARVGRYSISLIISIVVIVLAVGVFAASMVVVRNDYFEQYTYTELEYTNPDLSGERPELDYEEFGEYQGDYIEVDREYSAPNQMGWLILGVSNGISLLMFVGVGFITFVLRMMWLIRMHKNAEKINESSFFISPELHVGLITGTIIFNYTIGLLLGVFGLVLNLAVGVTLFALMAQIINKTSSSKSLGLLIGQIIINVVGWMVTFIFTIVGLIGFAFLFSEEPSSQALIMTVLSVCLIGLFMIAYNVLEYFLVKSIHSAHSLKLRELE